MNIKPLGERVLVKVDKPETKTSSGIVLTDMSLNPNYFKGEVIICGELYHGESIKAGDHVAFLKYGYEDMGDNFYLVEPKALLAILSD